MTGRVYFRARFTPDWLSETLDFVVIITFWWSSSSSSPTPSSWSSSLLPSRWLSSSPGAVLPSRPSWDERLAGKTLDEEQRPRSSFRPYLAPCSFRQWIFRSVLCYFSAILSRLSLYILLNSTFSFFEFLMPSVLTLSQLHWLCLWYNFLMFSSYTYNCTC